MDLRWLARWFPGGAAAPPWPDLQPTVEWQLCGVCNYDCSYCIQARAKRKGAPDEATLARIVASLCTLPGRWEIKVSGGEPFAVPGLLERAVAGLLEGSAHDLSVLTNLSAPLPRLAAFCEALGERLRVTSASLHLESVEPEAFFDKAAAYAELLQRHNPRASLVVNAVLVPGHVAQHLDLRAAAARRGLRYFPQLMKLSRGGVYPYDAREAALLRDLCGEDGDLRRANQVPCYQGLHCEAGRWYFVLDQGGEAWACRPAKRLAAGEPGAALGRLTDGSFRRAARGGPCPYPRCPCTVPAARGVVRGPAGERLGASGTSEEREP